MRRPPQRAAFFVFVCRRKGQTEQKAEQQVAWLPRQIAVLVVAKRGPEKDR
jgi:hypothetical protein